jgi:hypothetical protein
MVPLLSGAESGSNEAVADFRISRNDGEVLITIMSEHAAYARGIQRGHSIAFKSPGDARPYVKAAEADGFTFEGKELIGA